MYRDSFRPRRHSIRLQDRDYARASAYFVTVKAVGQGEILGSVADGTVVLNDRGRLVEACWQAIPQHFSGVRLDAWVVMPDHLHGIVVLPHGVPVRHAIENALHSGKSRFCFCSARSCVGAQHAAPCPDSTPQTTPRNNRTLVTPGSLGCIIRSFKSASTRAINLAADTPGASLWQRNYHERVIRDDAEFEVFRRYTRDNPLHWGKNPGLESPSPPRYFLHTERLGFRPWSLADLALAAGLWGDERVTRLIGGPFSPGQVRERLAREIASQEAHEVQYWPIFLLATGEHLGCCGLRLYRLEQRIYEIGFHLRFPHWGHGYAAEAARAVMAHAFGGLGAAGLFAGHNPANEASRRLLAKLGFRYTHDEYYPPTGLNHPSYMLTAEEYGSGNSGDRRQKAE